MKIKHLVSVVILGLMFLVGSAVAADYAKMEVDLYSNDSRGQMLYKKNCRAVCHDGEHGSGKARSPMDLLMDDWEKIAENIAKVPCLKNWPKDLSEEDVSDIFSYLYSGAADSPTPVS